MNIYWFRIYIDLIRIYIGLIWVDIFVYYIL